MLQVHSCFEELIIHAKKTEMPVAFRADLIRQLEYFKIQSLCDLDRRDPPLVLRSHWLSLKGQVRGLNFFETFQAPEHFWRILQAFVYEVEPSSLIIPRPEKPTKPASKCDNWKPVDFFDHMVRALEARVQLTEEERLMVLYGILYLRAESLRAPHLRDDRKIKEVWVRIQKYLERLGLMGEFREEEKLKAAIKFFIDRSI